MVVVADGTNLPTVTGADEWETSFGYLNTSGIPNLLEVWHDGIGRRYAWSKAATPAVVDLVAPTLSSAVINGDTLTLTYSEALNSTAPTVLAFTVSGAGGVTQTPTAASITGSSVALTLGTPAEEGDTVVVSYSPPALNPIKDSSGNIAAGASIQSVTNQTSGSETPLLAVASINSGLIDNGNGSYTAKSGLTPWGGILRPAGMWAANQESWISVDALSGTNGTIAIGVASTNTATADTGLILAAIMSTSTNLIRWVQSQPINSTPNDVSGVTLSGYGPNLRIRLRRKYVATVPEWTIERSTDAGATWAVMYTFVSTAGAAYYPVIFTPSSHTIYNPRGVGIA